jgi:hypothetical protein
MPITFEGGILIAGVSTFWAVVIACHLWPSFKYKPLDERFTNDRFGLYVPVRPYESANVQSLLQGLGALEVRELA